MRRRADDEDSTRAGTWWRVACVLACVCAICPAAASAQPLRDVVPGAAFSVTLPIPSAGGAAPASFSIEPADGVTILGPLSGPLHGSSGLRLTAIVAATVPPGVFPAATVTFAFAPDHQVSVQCQVRVLTPDAESSEQRPRVDERQALDGVAYAGATEVDVRGRTKADVGLGIEVSGRVNGSTRVDASYVRGWNPGISRAFRYGMHPWRGHLRVRTPQFSFEAGEVRTNDPLSGVRAVADGASLQKIRGALIGSVVAARPKYFGGGGGGHLFEGSIGLRWRAGSIRLLASELARPERPSGLLVRRRDADETEPVDEELEHVGSLFSRENRVRTGGLETVLTLGRHNLVARTGWLELENPSGQRGAGMLATATYSFRAPAASFAVHVRSSPPSPPGVTVPGDTAAAGGKLTLAGPLALRGQAYWSEYSLHGRSSATRARGITAGLEYSSAQRRISVQGKYRESKYLLSSVTRSVVVAARSPFGDAAGLDLSAEYGERSDGSRRRRLAMYRGALYLEGEKASLTLSGAYNDYGVSSPRVSLDLSGSVAWRGATFEAGAGISRAGILGEIASGWTMVELPAPGDLTVMLGLDYDRWSLENSPYLAFTDGEVTPPPWRFTFGIRRKLSLPVPFVK